MITRSRFVAIVGGHKIIDIPRNHKMFRRLAIDRSAINRYTIELDLGEFPGGLTGHISLNYHIDHEMSSIP